MAKDPEKEMIKKLLDREYFVRKYFYTYYSCTDYLKALGKSSMHEYKYFKDINHDYAITPRLLKQIISNPQTKKNKMEFYAGLFEDGLARLNNGDGTFSFILPSGKVIPDKFASFFLEGGMKFKLAGVQDLVFYESVDGSTRPKQVTKKVTTYNFINNYETYLIDQNKVRNMADVELLLVRDPEYIKQIPLNLFKPNNIDKMKKAIKLHYEKYVAYAAEKFLAIPWANKKMVDYDVLIDQRIRMYDKIQAKKEQEKLEEEQKPIVFEKPVASIKTEKPKFLEEEKKDLYPTLYWQFEELSLKYDGLMVGKNALQKLMIRKALLEDKIVLAEQYRDKMLSAQRYAPKISDNFLNKYLDQDEEWALIEQANQKIKKDVDLFDFVIIQDLNNKLIAWENKIKNYLSFYPSVIANLAENVLNQNYPLDKWKVNLVNVPDLKNTKQIFRFNKWVDTMHKTARYVAVTNTHYPKSLLKGEIVDQNEGKRMVDKIKKQIIEGNIILIANCESEYCELSSQNPASDKKLDSKLSCLSLEQNDIYCKKFPCLVPALEKKVMENIKQMNQAKKPKKKEQITENVNTADNDQGF